LIDPIKPFRRAAVSNSVATTKLSIVPQHVAVVMDGNGRWAQKRFLPRVAGHRQGVDAVRALMRAAGERGVKHLTVFAFSSENWKRPQDEVSYLMELFFKALRDEMQKLHENGIRFRAIGDLSALSPDIQTLIAESEKLTAQNTALTFNVAVNYGGRWDLMQAVTRACEAGHADQFERYLAFADQPDPDLFIRTGGERRISNFLLWQLAYTELYFTDTLWPDFGEDEFVKALDWFASRERRFGQTGEQVRGEAVKVSA
jgi:undecaprenyl diphosphate synthase